MLGLLRNASGPVDVSPLKAGKQPLEPVIREVTPSPEAEQHDPLDSTAQTEAILSPTASVSNSIHMSKRSSLLIRRSGVMRASFGHKGVSSTTIVKEQYVSIRQRAHRELGAGVHVHVFDTSYAGLLEWIRAERLTRLPHKGGCWDRVLVAAQYFAEQVHRLNLAIDFFTEESGAASNLVFGQCLLLLELGHENAAALETAFNLFYRFGLDLTPLLHADYILSSSPAIVEQVNRAFSELISLVSGIAVTYYSVVHNGRSSTRLDIFATFGHSIDTFRARVAHCSHEMWTYVLRSRGLEDGCHVEALQKWLAPQDKTLALLAMNHTSLASRPEEFTCNWFQTPINTFFKSNKKILVVEGVSGTGKTTLANWVLDRLQRPVGRKMISQLSFFFNSSVMVQATALGMLKALLHQLLSQHIGEVALYQIIAAAQAESLNLSTAKEQETRMWEALEAALHVISDREGDITAIVIDGVDEMDGQKPAAQQVVKKLHALVNHIEHIRLIQFSQPLDVTPTASTTTIKLSTDNMSGDIQTIIQSGISWLTHFSDRDDSAREHIVESLVTASGSSVLRASLSVQYLQLQKTHGAFDEALASLVKPSVFVNEIVQLLLTALKLDADSKSILSFLISAERPLSLEEVGLLLQAHPESSRVVERKLDLECTIKAISAFTIKGEGLITIRHNAVKQALISVPGTSKVSLQLKERHRDLVIRLLLCAKKHIKDEAEPHLEFLEESKLESHIGNHRLLEYTVRYWTEHFRKSPSLFKTHGALELPKDFSAAFPTSVNFVMMEAACWKAQSFPHEAMELFIVAFRVREALFGLEHATVLQSALICAMFCETVLVKHEEAIKWYARAIKIGRVVLGFQSDILVHCCSSLLRISESFVTKKRTEIMTYREETYTVLISSYTHRFGASSTEVLEIYRKLAELYVFICEEEKATEIYIKIKEITVVIEGGHSEEFDTGSRHLDVVLKKHKHSTEVDTFGGLLFGYREEAAESWTIVRIEKLILYALELIEKKEFVEAEEVYIELWLKLTEYCRTVDAREWHEKKIEVMIKYAHFLRIQKRIEEASAVLLCCWREYSIHTVSAFESIIILLKELAISLKVVGLITISLTVFQKCWSWFKSSHKTDTTIYKEIQEHITIISKELVKTTTTTVVTKTSSETVIREVFESSFSETTVTSTTMELCESLASIYIKEERWSEAITILKSTLKRSWAAFFAESIDSVTMSATLFAESVSLVVKLASCYISQKRYEKAEYLYLRLYRVHRKHHRISDAVVIKYCEIYIEFLRKHELTAQLISFYQELLVEYRSFYGLTHTKTITLLYALGDICRVHYLTHGYWIEYYLEIVVNLNKGVIICHEDAFRALIIVAEHYYETMRYSESIVYFKSIIATFCKFGTKFKYFEDIIIVQKLFEKYYRAMEETRIELHVQITVVKEIREACFKFFGESSAISISVTVILAELCSKSETYMFEAVAFYEHILKHSKTVSTTVIKRSQTTLRSLYVKQVTSKTTTVTKEITEKATMMTYERYLEIREHHSCTHETTLTILKELVMLYHKQSKLELAIKEMRSLILECIMKVTSSEELIRTAEFMAGIYIACGYSSHAYEFLREIKLQIIYKFINKSCGFNVTSIGQISFAFLAAFEFYLRADYTLTIAGFMAELMAELVYYERFVSSIKIKAEVRIVCLHAARLRRVLIRTGRVKDFNIVEKRAFEYFISHETAIASSCTKASIELFVCVLLAHLSERTGTKNFVASAGHAAVHELNMLLQSHKYKEALELAKCTFKYLMAHEGLDDPTEVTLGFHLCLMLVGRGEHKHKPSDPAVHKAMVDLSNKILHEVFDICKKNKINLIRCPLPELNELIALLGEQKDNVHLEWLLSELWQSRDGQSTWSQDVILNLGSRLVQARFAAGKRALAIQLAEDLVYNVRRVHGSRHKQTLSMYRLLASLYTSTAQYYQSLAASNGAATDKKRANDYFKKAVCVHEDVLKLVVDADCDGSDDDDDLDSEVESARGVANGTGQLTSFASRDEEIEVIRKHLRLLKLSTQRYGGWVKASDVYHDLTANILAAFGSELKMGEEHILAKKWKTEGFGAGKAEGGMDEDGFKAPSSWAICY